MANLDDLYRNLMTDGGWSYTDIDNMDITHFMSVMDSKVKKTMDKQDVEDWYKSI